MLARRNLVMAVMVVVVLVIIGFIVHARTNDVTLSKPTGERGPDGLTAFYNQTLEWADCGTDKCTWVKVPVDYHKPRDATLRLRVKYRQAESKDSGRILFINPGGPGGSGVDFVDPFADRASEGIRQGYGIVGFDPRGVGASNPIECLSDKEFAKFVDVDPDPDEPSEVDDLLAQTEILGEGCKAESGDLINHVSTIEVARDLDVLRALMGESSLDYYGASYGTQIGATYAELFAPKVGRMVLDGAIDPTLSDEKQGFGQAKGFQQALEAYVEWCVTTTACPLGTDVDAGLQQVADLVAGLDQKPLKTTSQRKLTEAMGFYGIAVTLYDRESWPYLSTALAAAVDRSDGTVLLALADVYFQRGPDGTYADNSGEAIYAVRCLDNPGKVTVDDVDALLPEYVKAAPIFGRVFAWSAMGCTDWPGKSTEEPITIDGAGAKPIVVIGTTRDPATPYVWATALAKQLQSGVLVTREGDGHTGYRAGNDCVDGAVDRYLLEGIVPKDGLECKAK